MQRELSRKFRMAVDRMVAEAVATDGTVDVGQLAEAIRLQHLEENVAREDVERLVVQRAQALGAAMAFSAEHSENSHRFGGQ